MRSRAARPLLREPAEKLSASIIPRHEMNLAPVPAERLYDNVQ